MPKAASAGSTFVDRDSRPAWKMRLIVRLEEYGNDGLVKRTTDAQKISSVLKGTTPQRANSLQVQKDPNAPQGVTRFVLVGASGGSAPQDRTTSEDDKTFVVTGVIPRTAQHGINGIRQADTLRAELRFVDLPFDPRVIRACAVKFFAGTMSQAQFTKELQQEDRVSPDRESDGLNPLGMLPDTFVDELGRTRSNLRFQGFVDKWTIHWPDEGEPTVELECRDNTSLLIEQDAPPAYSVSGTDPIDKAIADYLSRFPQFEGLSVEYRPTGTTPVPTLGKGRPPTATKQDAGPSPKGGGSQKTSVWDYLTDVCGEIGHVIRCDGTAVFIQAAATLYSNDLNSARQDDPYRPVTVDGPEGQVRLPFRTMIYGQNIQTLEVTRNYARNSPTNVEVRSYLPRRKNVLVARYPEKNDGRVNALLPGSGGADQKWTVYRVKGIEDQTVLKLTARSIYEAIGRNEILLHLKTRDLSSFGQDGADANLFDLKATDTVELRVLPGGDEFNTLGRIEQILEAEDRARKFLEKLGHSPTAAAAYAKARAASGFQSLFRLKSAGFAYDVDDGVQIDMELVNYIEVRLADKGGNAVTAPSSPKPGQQGPKPPPKKNPNPGPPANLPSPTVLLGLLPPI